MFKARKYNKLLKNIGEVSIKNDSIIIDVDNKVLEKMLSISGNILILKSGHLKNKYNKQVVYHIKDMNFNNVSIFTDETVTFEKCNFVNGVNIIKADFLLFNNNKYISEKDEYDDEFFVGKKINTIMFYDEKNSNENVAFRIDADKIQIIDSSLLKDNGHTNIKCNRLSMNNSRIGGETSYIEAGSMFLIEKSSIHNSKSCMIECQNISGDNIIEAPRIICNGKLYTRDNKKKDLK